MMDFESDALRLCYIRFAEKFSFHQECTCQPRHEVGPSATPPDSVVFAMSTMSMLLEMWDKAVVPSISFAYEIALPSAVNLV